MSETNFTTLAAELKTVSFWDEHKKAVWAVFLVFLGVIGGKINDLPGFKNTVDATRADLVRLEQDVKNVKEILNKAKLLNTTE